MRAADNIDLYRAVKLYIDQYGDQAALQAAMQSDAPLVGTERVLVFRRKRSA